MKVSDFQTLVTPNWLNKIDFITYPIKIYHEKQPYKLYSSKKAVKK